MHPWVYMRDGVTNRTQHYKHINMIKTRQSTTFSFSEACPNLTPLHLGQIIGGCMCGHGQGQSDHACTGVELNAVVQQNSAFMEKFPAACFKRVFQDQQQRVVVVNTFHQLQIFRRGNRAKAT